MSVVFTFLLSVFLSIHRCGSQLCGEHMKDGASCGVDKWRQDSFCFRGKCIQSVERLFKVRVVIVYPENSLSTEERQKGILLVGEGVGLSWKKKRKLRKGMKDQWFTTLSYTVGGKSVLCKKATECEYSQKYIEFRVFLGNKEMFGPNFRVDLPASGSLAPKNALKVPRVTFYPWFKKQECSVVAPRSFDIEGMGKRKISVLLPASFYENELKKYKTLIVFGQKTLLTMKPIITDVTARRGLMEEIVLIGLEVKDSIRDLIPSHAPVLRCKQTPLRKGDRTCDYCMKCLSDEFTEPCDRYEFLREIKKCANKWSVPGLGYHYLSGVLDTVLPQLAPEYRAKINKKSLGIMGYGLAGMMACHAALKLSHRFGTAICMSPRLSWPDLEEKRRDFFDLLEKESGGFCTLKIYIDANENDDWQFTTAAVFKSAEEAVQLLRKKYGFTLNENLFFFPLSYRGPGRVDTLKPDRVLARAWIPLTTMYRAAGSSAGRSCSSSVAARTFLGRNSKSAVEIASENTDEENKCKGQVPVVALVSSIIGTLLVTLVVTVIVMHFCRSPAGITEKEPMLQ